MAENHPILSLQISRGGKIPLFLELSRAVADLIRRGKLSEGSRLPGSRKLCGALGVHRNTVIAALEQLQLEGWVDVRPRSGTFVARQLPGSRSSRSSDGDLTADCVPIAWQLPALALPKRSSPPLAGVLALVGGLPDMRLVPFEELSRAHRRALLADESSLDYGSSWGHPRLRQALTQLLSETRGLRVAAENVLVTRGSQMALYLVARTLVEGSTTIAVEHLGYPPAWQALRMAGAQLRPVPVDAHGLVTEKLSELCQRTKVAAVYVTPHHQYPTTVTLSARRRQHLLELARRHRFLILEDDYDHEQHYAGRPVMPLASEDSQVVLYIGTFSKVLAPGLRVGYAAGPAAIVERMMQWRTYIDRQGDLPLEAALAEMIEEGALQRHTRRVTRHSLRRRDALVDALQRHLGDDLRFTVPPGGMALWAKARTSTVAWSRRALERGVLVHPGAAYRFDGGASQCLRLGFGRLDPAEIERAVQILAGCRRPSSLAVGAGV